MLNWQHVKMELPAVSVLICGSTSRTLFHQLTDIGLKLKSMPLMASSSLPKLKSHSKITPEPTLGNCHLKCFCLFSWFISSNSLTIIPWKLTNFKILAPLVWIICDPVIDGWKQTGNIRKKGRNQSSGMWWLLFDFGLNTSVPLLSEAPSYPWKVPDLIRFFLFLHKLPNHGTRRGKKNKNQLRRSGLLALMLPDAAFKCRSLCFQEQNLDWFPRMRAMSLVSSDADGEQNEMRSLQDKLESTMKLVSNLSGQLTELKEQVGPARSAFARLLRCCWASDAELAEWVTTRVC